MSESLHAGAAHAPGADGAITLLRAVADLPEPTSGSGPQGRAPVLDVTRRPTVADDDALLRELFRQGRPDLDELPEPARSSLLDLQYLLVRVRQLSQRPDAQRWTLLAAGEAVGSLVVDAAGPTPWIMDIAVAATHRRRGVARAAIQAVLRDAPGPVGLRVRTDARAARSLFEALGFDYRLAPRLALGEVEMLRPGTGA